MPHSQRIRRSTRQNSASSSRQENPETTRFRCNLSSSKVTADREASAFNIHPDSATRYGNLEPVSDISLTVIENYLKDLMAILSPKVDNSNLCDGIDRVSCSIADCIDPAESSLHKKKIRTELEKPSPRLDRSGDIFSGLDRIDSKIADRVKLVEDTLRTGSFDKQKEVRSETHWEPEKSSP